MCFQSEPMKPLLLHGNFVDSSDMHEKQSLLNVWLKLLEFILGYIYLQNIDQTILIKHNFVYKCFLINISCTNQIWHKASLGEGDSTLFIEEPLNFQKVEY